MREKLIELLAPTSLRFEEAVYLADHLIANGVTFDKDKNVPINCQNCTHHDTDTCPENRVWCRMLHRYMKPDGYCSFGVKGETNEKVV